MKRSRLSYDEWQCIVSKDMLGKMVNSELLNISVEVVAAAYLKAEKIPL